VLVMSGRDCGGVDYDDDDDGDEYTADNGGEDEVQGGSDINYDSYGDDDDDVRVSVMSECDCVDIIG